MNWQYITQTMSSVLNHTPVRKNIYWQQPPLAVFVQQRNAEWCSEPLEYNDWNIIEHLWDDLWKATK